MFALTLLSLLIIAVPFVVYPLLLWLRSSVASTPIVHESALPAVDLIICAYNEAQSIAWKVRNAMNLDYPADRLTVWVASDGSTDGTAEIATAVADSRVRVLDLSRGGKATALNSAAEAGCAPVIAFSDANSEWRADALKNLVAPLSDPAVGGVAGDQRYYSAAAGDTTESASGERSYWSFDRALKRWQARAGSATSATGAIYCVRRSLFEPAPLDATDDFMISTAVIEKGYRLAFADNAVAYEPAAGSTGLEFRRKVRVISRGLRGVYYRRKLLNPLHGGLYSVQLLIHKLWRRLVWVPSLVLLLSAPFSIQQGGFPSLVGWAVLLFAALAGLGFLFAGLRKYRLISICSYVAMVNVACALATINLLRGNRISQWHLPRDTGSTTPKFMESEQ